MKSAIITVTNSGQGIIDALSMTERIGSECGLEKKPLLHLRLLAEELFGMLRSIAGDVEASYWLNAEGKSFELHMKSDVDMSIEMRDRFLAASSNGQNEAAKSFMGKIRNMIAEILLAAQETLPYTIEAPFFYPADNISGSYLWSMSGYLESLQNNREDMASAHDDLEKSIVFNIADDIKVKIKGKNVEIILYKTF